MVVFNLSTWLVFLFYIAVKFFTFLFNSSIATMPDILIRLCNFVRKSRCMIVCCISQLIIDHPEIDGVDKDED